MRYRKGDVTHNLLAAVQRYVHAHGGGIVVIGGIEVHQDFDAHKFKIAVGCLGAPPKKPESA